MLSKKNFHKTMRKLYLPADNTAFIRKGLIFLVFLLLIGFSSGSILKAQNPEWKVYNTSNSGLPWNDVTCLTVDGGGNVWIVSRDRRTDIGGGLVKYNGANWSVLDTSNSGLPDNYLNCLDIGESGYIWIGTGGRFSLWFIGSGLVKYDGINWIVYDTSNSGLPSNDVRCITTDGNRDKWIGTYYGGLAKYDGTNWNVYNTSNSGLPDNYLNCLAIDEKGNKWIGTLDGGLVKYDGANWTVYNKSNSGLPGNDVTCLAVDQNENIWIGIVNLLTSIGGGLVKYNDTNWTFYNTSNSGLPDNYVNCIAIDGNGNKWIGTYKGLAKYDGTNWTVFDTSNSGLPDNTVNCIAIDSNGNIWMGTDSGLAVFNEGGIVSVKEKENNNKHYPNKYILSQNYPNPFNPSTTIKYSIPKQSYVTLKVYDILGNEIETLANEEKPAGEYEVTLDAVNLPSGVYFYRLQAGSFVETKKMILLK